MSQCRGVAAFNGRYVEPVRSSVLGHHRTLNMAALRHCSGGEYEMRTTHGAAAI